MKARFGAILLVVTTITFIALISNLPTRKHAAGIGAVDPLPLKDLRNTTVTDSPSSSSQNQTAQSQQQQRNKPPQSQLMACGKLHECALINCEDLEQKSEQLVCLERLANAGDLCLIDGDSSDYDGFDTQCNKPRSQASSNSTSGQDTQAKNETTSDDKEEDDEKDE